MNPLDRRTFLKRTGQAIAAGTAAAIAGPALLDGAEASEERGLVGDATAAPVGLVSGSVTGSSLGFPLVANHGLPPAQVATVSSARRNNIFERGRDVVRLALSSPSGRGPEREPSAFEVLDVHGAVVRSGPVTGASVDLGPASGWRLGWYRLRLVGSNVDPVYGNAYGAATFAVVTPSPALPSVPAFTTAPNAADPIGDGADFVLCGLIDEGARRMQIPDAANPSGTAEGWRRDMAFDRSWWQDPVRADPVRPHQHLIAFENGALSSSQLAGVTETVRLLYPDVVWFEGPVNEPDAAANLSPQQCAQAMRAFAAAVKAGNRDAKVLGPGLVTVNDSAWGYWEQFFAAGGGEVLDGVSTHVYNCFMSDPWLGDQTMGTFVKILERHGVAGLPRFVTEGGGDLFADYGSYHPRRQLHWSITRLLQQERYGFTKERSYYFYDTSHGFWAQPSWLEGLQAAEPHPSDLHPIAVAMRQLSLALRGTRYSSQVHFGPAADFLRAYVFSGRDGQTVALYSAGSPSLSVTLAVPGRASATDLFGNPVALERRGSTVTLELSDLPTYLHTGHGPVRAVDVGGGLMHAGANLALGASPRTNGSAAGLEKVNKGRQYSAYLDNQDISSNSPWFDSTGTFPALLELSWDSARTVGRVGVFFSPPWHQCTAPVRFSVETLAPDNSTWQSQYSYSNATATSEPFADFVTGCTRETFYDEAWVFNIVLPKAVRTTAIRLNVAATTFGAEPDDASYSRCNGNAGSKPHLVVRDFRVFAA